MKNIVLLFLLLFSFPCQAQTDPVFIYGEVGGGAGTGGSGKLALNVLFLQDHLATVGYYFYGRRASDIPPDYHAGLLGSLPNISMSIVTLMYGKTFVVPDQKRVRFTLQGGLGMGTLTKPENYSYTYGGYFGSNYEYDNVRSFIGGVVLSPSAEFPLIPSFGLKLGLTSFINYYSSSVEVEGSILFGRLRLKPRHRHIMVEESSQEKQ